MLGSFVRLEVGATRVNIRLFKQQYSYGTVIGVFCIKHSTVEQRKKVTAFTFFPRGRGRIKEAQIRAKYAKWPCMKSRDFWWIEWTRLDLSWAQITGC